MKRIALAAILALTLAPRPSSGAEPAAEAPPVVATNAIPAGTKQDDIRALMELTGAGRMGAQFVDQIVASLKQTYPDVPDRFWQAFAAGINTDKLVEKLVPVYDKHLTHDDVRQVIEFYRSPVGRKMIAVLPQISRDSMKIGEAWGREIAEQAAARIEKEGYAK